MLSHNLQKVALEIFRCSGTSSFGRQCRKMLAKGDWAGLVSLEIDPCDYTDARVFRKDYACANFLRKIQIDIPGINREAVALENFWKSERQCWDSNRRFDRLKGGTLSLAESKAVGILLAAREWIKDVLGPLPDNLEGRFGPGATYEVRGKLATVPDKLRSRGAITREARDLLPLLSGSLLLGPRDRQRDPETVRGNRFTTVPKDAKKDRGICIEPGFNVWLQLAVGGVMRERLKRKASINLTNAQSKHRLWAKQASHDGLKATIDLSNASDTVSKELVRWLMPPDWFCLLNCLRSPITLISEKAVFLEKFSSMGNGFTFELETLIFASLCYASGCGESGVDYLVFGDDIIVDSEFAEGLLQVLRFCGFTPNPRKTFLRGWFRESCGGDYFKGMRVTPHYQKVDPSSPVEWFTLLNGLRRASPEGMSGVGFEYTFLYAAWLSALQNVPSKLHQLKGPADLGDLVIHDHDYTVDYSKGYGRVRVLKPIIDLLPLSHWDSDVVMAYALYKPERPNDRENSTWKRFGPRWPFSESVRASLGVTPRGEPLGYRVGYAPFG